MRIKIVLAIALNCFLQNSFAQIKWPAVTQQTKPWTRWWWQGSAVDKTNLTAAMQQYQQAGLGGLEITPIYGVKGAEDKFIDFLSPKWMEMFQYTLSEAKRLNLELIWRQEPAGLLVDHGLRIKMRANTLLIKLIH
jgi:hypothetical protein